MTAPFGAGDARSLLRADAQPQLYRLVKNACGKRTIIAFGLRESEARILQHCVRREMKRRTIPNDDGEAYFEATEVLYEPEQ